MKDWCIPLLKLIRPEMVSEQSYEEELKQPVFVWKRISDLFLHQFESEGMEELLGSVLCNLPKDEFDKILKVYPFFILLRSAAMCQEIHTGGRENIPEVIFSQAELGNMSFSERQAVVCHELAHVALGHLSRPFSLNDPWKKKMELEADDLCREWGFEIDAVRAYLKKQKGESDE